MADLSLKNVTKIYDKSIYPAVNDFNLEIADKEFIVFVGPSGCGKSTTLRMIAGLEEITDGEIYIGDRLVNNVEPKDRDIAMVFQNYALYPHMTVYDNIAYGLKLKRQYTKAQIREKVEEAARILEISEFLDRKPKHLSGGQRQRVAIGRAIVRSPKVFLMDEPLSNLDAKLRNQMRAEIILLRKRINTTFIYVTHDQTEAMTLGDRIVIMKDGIIQQVGTPTEVFNEPKNLFVAGFIGAPQMNFFDAKLQQQGSAYFTEVGGCRFALSDEANVILKQRSASEEEVILGIRPEHITLAKSESEKTPGCDYIPVELLVCEMMGSELHMHLMLNDKKIIVRIPTLGLKNQDIETIKNTKEFYIHFPAEAIHLFHKETEQNLLY